MKKVDVKDLQPGMIIGKTVCSANGLLLFTPGTVIDDEIIKKMLTDGVEFVEIRDGDNSEEEKLTVKEIISTVEKLFTNITLASDVEHRTVKQTVNDLLRQVLKDRLILFRLTEVKDADSYFFTHSVNVCMLSLILGLLLKMKGEQLKALGLAALLHDIGRTRVPQGILYKPSSLSDEEYEKVKKHTVYGYEILSGYSQFPETVALTALQHHERLDGSGYPYNLKGEEISLFARIVGLVDVFDALLAERPFRKAFFPHQAVEIILNSSGKFDPDILKVFAENVVIYPMGCMVSLNTGEIGVVVDRNRGQQARPVVRIVFDNEGSRLNQIKEIDLSKTTHMFIVSILSDDKIEKLYV